MKTCKVENCFRPVFTNGYCSMHKGLHYAVRQAAKQKVSKVLLKYSTLPPEYLIPIADRHFNKFIRERDRNGDSFYCPTCKQTKKIEGDNYHACHLFPAGHYSWLRYNEDNVFGGCQSCNYYKHGAGYSFTPYVIEKIGQERYDKLLALNIYHKHHGFKWEREALIKIIETYKHLNKIAA